jgi:hypothetical protein
LSYMSASAKERPLFLGQVDNRLAFSIKTPATDHYYLVENSTITAAMIKFFGYDRHLLTVGRAKSVLRRLADPELVFRWQKVLVPHMQTSLLQRLQQRPTAWTDISLVEKELATRR